MGLDVDIERVRELIALAKEAGVSELTVTNSAGRITIKKGFPAFPAAAAPTSLPSGSGALGMEGVTAGGAALSQAPTGETAPATSRFIPVTAPVVGTVFLGERPEAEPLVRAGQRVREGQLLCVVESMRVLNEVTAPADGVIAQILAESGQPVEYGHQLMIIELESP